MASRARQLISRLFVRFADRDKDGDFDRDDLILIARKQLERYLPFDAASEVVETAKQQIMVVEATRAIQKAETEEEEAELRAGAVARKLSGDVANEGMDARGLVVSLLSNFILARFGVRIPTRVLNFVIEAIVNLIGRLKEEVEKQVAPKTEPEPDVEVELAAV